jgi:hypothetical protein
MNRAICLFALSLAATGPALSVRAAEEPAKPRPAEMRAPFRNLTPEERRARLQEFRANGGGLAGLTLEERERIREEVRSLPPEERPARIRELREKWGLGTNATERPEGEKRREEWMTLTPEERQARLREYRERRAANPRFSPEERAARREVIRERFDTRLKALRERKSEGAITRDETERLDRLEELAQRFARRDRPGLKSRPAGNAEAAPPPPSK